jgi:hypothetical protein
VPQIVLVTLIGVLATISIVAANFVAKRVAAAQPARIAVFANFGGPGAAGGAWRGLILQASGTDQDGQIRCANATVQLPTPSPQGSRPFSVDLSDPQARSAERLAAWATGTNAGSAASTEVATLLAESLRLLGEGATAPQIESQLQLLAEQLGSTARPQRGIEIKRYAPGPSTAVFFAVFCAIFLPPSLTWLVLQYRRNLARLRGM